MNKFIPDDYKKTETYLKASASERTAMNRQYRLQQKTLEEEENKKRQKAEVAEFEKVKDGVFDKVLSRLGVMVLKSRANIAGGLNLDCSELMAYGEKISVDFFGDDIKIRIKEEYRDPLIFSKSTWTLEDSKKVDRLLRDMECCIDSEMSAVESQVEEIKRKERERAARNAMREELMSSLDPKYHGLISSKE